ncbi:MAG: hypothetical protein ACPG2Y_02835, partial [Acholeplasmataceae bacterium]
SVEYAQHSQEAQDGLIAEDGQDDQDGQDGKSRSSSKYGKSRITQCQMKRITEFLRVFLTLTVQSILII